MNKKILFLSIFVIFLIGCTSVVDQPEETPKLEISEMQLELKERFQVKQNTMYAVTWRVTSSENPATANMTQYFNGKDFRIDQERQVPFRAYYIDGSLTSCANVNVTWICEAGEYQLGPFELIEKDILEDATVYEVIKLEPRTLVDVETNCYLARYNTITVEYCFNEEDMLLYVSQDLGGITSTFEATSFNTEVTEADFVREV